MSNKKIVILGTGGTIAGKAGSASDNVAYVAAQLGVEQLVAAIPALAGAGNLLVEQVAQIDSKDMTFEVWADLAARVSHFLDRDDVQGIVITHGTDTLEETAYFLQAVLNPAKPVVLTCAMRPATSLAPDGPQNVMDAVAVVSHVGASGVVLVCAGTIHGAYDVQKIHTYRLDAFSSGDAGPIGLVEEGQAVLWRNWPVAQSVQSSIAAKFIAHKVSGRPWPKVEIVMSHAGAGTMVVDALVAAGVQGLVLASTGNGSLHRSLEAALFAAQASGVQLVRASRCPNGRILPKSDDRIADSKGLSAVKARIDLILRLLA
ncbi:MAG: asparaginase [Pseudomonadota bacterium]